MNKLADIINQKDIGLYKNNGLIIITCNDRTTKK